MKFLGHVNFFRGRMEGGKVHFSTLAWESPEHAGTPTQPARVFIRPHELDVDVLPNGHPALQAVVTRIHSAGPNVRLELVAESGERLCAELTQDRYRSLEIPSAARYTSRLATSRCLPTSPHKAATGGRVRAKPQAARVGVAVALPSRIHRCGSTTAAPTAKRPGETASGGCGWDWSPLPLGEG